MKDSGQSRRPGSQEKDNRHHVLTGKKEMLDSFDENAILILCIWNWI